MSTVLTKLQQLRQLWRLTFAFCLGEKWLFSREKEYICCKWGSWTPSKNSPSEYVVGPLKGVGGLHYSKSNLWQTMVVGLVDNMCPLGLPIRQTKCRDKWAFSVIREGCGKSKWKFKMAFAMKGGGVSRGSRVPHTYFEKWFLLAPSGALIAIPTY